MKKLLLSSLMALILLTQNGCFGSFELTNKVYSFNAGIDNDIAREAVFLVMVIVPIYEFAAIFDALLFNTIEYWSGSNPIAMEEGEREERIFETPSATYKVTTTKNRIQIHDLSDENISMEIIYMPETQTWSVLHENNKIDMVRILNPNEAEVFLPGERVEHVYLSK